MKEILSELWLDPRRQLNDGTYPVKLRIQHRAKTYLYGTGKSTTKELWEKRHSKDRTGLSPKDFGAFQRLIKNVNDQQADANQILAELSPFDPVEFAAQFAGRHERNSLAFHFGLVIKEMKINNQVKTARVYETALTSLEKFFTSVKKKSDKELLEKEVKKKPDKALLEITAKDLQQYENWMFRQKRSHTSVSIYMRCLRAVFLRAVPATSELYPFKSYVIPAWSKKDNRLTVEQMGAFIKYRPDGEATELAKDIFMCSYWCFGCNVYDILLFKYSDIENGELKFYRKKTQRKTKVKEAPRPIIVPLNGELKRIFKRWGNKDQSGYIFDVLNKNMDAATERAAVDLFTHRMNDALKRIGKAIKMKNLTLSFSRRTAANFQRDMGVPYHVISQNMGHKNFSTTEKYLGLAKSADVVKSQQALVIPISKKRGKKSAS
jgi:integrase